MPVYIKRGATRPSFAVQLRENIGTVNEKPVDISDTSGIASVDFVASLDGGAKTIKKTAIRMYPSVGKDHAEFAAKGGWVRYDWDFGDTDTPGEFKIEFDLHWGTQVETFPNKGYFSAVVEVDLG
jgi:hypothetical protein